MVARVVKRKQKPKREREGEFGRLIFSLPYTDKPSVEQSRTGQNGTDK